MSKPWYQQPKYPLLIISYTLLTAALTLRITKQPYTPSIKAEQIESIVKGTTLGALVIGVAISSGPINQAQSSSIPKSNA